MLNLVNTVIFVGDSLFLTDINERICHAKYEIGIESKQSCAFYTSMVQLYLSGWETCRHFVIATQVLEMYVFKL